MKKEALFSLGVLLSGCAKDADSDGFKVGDDCDDLNPAVFPGATEVRGNGVDEDCDGADRPHAYIGDWSLDTITGVAADNYDYFFEFAGKTGSMNVADNLGASFTIRLNGEQSLALMGTASPAGAEGEFSLPMTGTYTYAPDVYQASVTFTCTTTESRLSCEGPMSIDGDAVNATAVFTK